ncbi:hypothetical protein TRICHSKD4_0563 [Roseibium sp. TrichSKD4]|uniref:phosphoribosyltransferase-like protein n=1 Tax=Roseibium sp. TrichSKD4 TaxID=744980 RepID=UPI0001E5654B|nr:hypothetical protein [Roseibium sp. TrichSKD4]EFO34074.1 hypothetical protein TRICHSKD4_0563 [Roseibium sp. TrichSKD4]
MSNLTELPVEWDYASETDHLEAGSVSFIKFLGRKLYQEYEPNQFQVFEDRLISWLNNLDDERDQKLLLALLIELFFMGRKEFEALYRSVYGGTLSRWIIEQDELNPFSTTIDDEIKYKLNACWICPITDSLRINSFLKVNGLKTMEHRPDWKSLVKFGDKDKIRAYLQKNDVTKIILLEDFVGSGTQVQDALDFVEKHFRDLNFLICPLVVCPKGDEKIRERTQSLNGIDYSPGMLIPEEAMFKIGSASANPELNAKIWDLFLRLQDRLDAPNPESMLGFKKTGAQVVMYSNCPNNTLTIFHRESISWKPLFPRVNRV